MERIGTANDADDHGAGAEAVQLRQGATVAIRELLRQHPFLDALYPNLIVELGTWRLEGFGWGRYIDDVERRLRYVRVALIPWERVVHFRGWGTQVDDWITELFRDSHPAAEARLRDCLVRDDAITQATPLALRSLLGALRVGLLDDPAPVEDMMRRMRAAARLVREAEVSKGMKPPRVDWSLYHEDRLWPKFESKARDRALWVALGTAGAEMRLPSIPSVHVGWRLASGLLVVMIVAGLFFLWKSPMFRIASVELDGLERLSASDINIVAGVFGESIFVIDTVKVIADLTRAFPELATIRVQVKLPAEIKISVVERQPVIGWLINNTENWIDENGVMFPARGEVEGLVVVESMDDKPRPKPEMSDQFDETVDQVILPPALVNAVLQLGDVVPDGTRIHRDDGRVCQSQ